MFASRPALAALLLLVLFAPAAATATTVEITDAAGRRVTVRQGVERVVLAEGRHLIAAAILEREAPTRRIVALGEALERFHPALFESYALADPHLREVPRIGDAHDNAFSPEAIADLAPDLIVMPIGSLAAMADSGSLAAFEALDVPVLFLDFRQHPMANALVSMRALGAAFDRSERAEAFIAYYRNSLAEIVERAAAQPDSPTLLLHVARSLGEECCMAFGNGNMGEVLEALGIRNPAAELSNQPFVRLNPETVLAVDPDVVVSTVASWQRPDGSSPLAFGYQVEPADPLTARAALLEMRPGWEQLGAMRQGRVHLIPHVLYDTPFQFHLAQLFAKWAWPDAFADLDPNERFAEFHERFMPFPLTGLHSLDLPALDEADAAQ